MIDDKSYDELFKAATELVKSCTPAERATCMFLGAILSEVRTLGVVANSTNNQVANLAKQFNQVSAGGRAVLTESAS